MRAVIMTQPGSADVLTLSEMPAPVIQNEHDILVRIKAAGINPLDTKLRARGTFYPDRLPSILGCDGAGIVEAIGTGVTRFDVGDEVFFFNGGIGADQGNYAEYTVLDEAYAALKPASLDFNHAAAVPLALITAWESLFDRTTTTTGKTVLVHAGAGGVGHLAIQLAKHAGAHVCTTVSDLAKADFAKTLGAELAINYREQDFVAVVNEWTGGEGVDIALDTVGGSTFTKTIGCVKQYGDLITLLQPGADTDWKEARMRNLRVSQELMLTPMHRGQQLWRKHQTRMLEQAAALFDAGKLRVEISHVLPLSEADHAHELIEQGGITGKIVLNCA